MARAQTTPTVTGIATQPFPERFINFGTPSQQDLGQSTRPVGLNPAGINYADCLSDMTLQYSVFLSGFTGQSLQVWVSQSGNCTQDTDRGNPGPPTCWLVASQVINQPQGSGYNFAVRVQDLVGSQQTVPNPPLYTRRDASACLKQPTQTAVQFTVFFVPVSGNAAAGTAFQQSITADLVGPSPPTGVSIADGDTLFRVNWTANSDADTAGYDIFMDPIRGSEQVDSSTVVSSTTRLVCPDSGAASPSTPDGGDAASGTSSSSDAGCYTVNVGPSAPAPGTTTCGSAVLQSQSVMDGGNVTPAIYDDAGNLISAGTSTQGSIGISTVLCDYLVGASCPAGQPAYVATSLTLSGESNGSYTVKGLTNGVTYNVAVAAVDNSGNVGPPSGEACDYPAPVNDFWQNYRRSGGQAGGGFCALDAVGMPTGPALLLGVLAAALLGATRRRGGWGLR